MHSLDSSRACADRRVGGTRACARLEAQPERLRPGAPRGARQPGHRRARHVPSRQAGRRRGPARARAGHRDRPRRDRSRGAARRRRRRRAAARRHRRVRSVGRGRAHRGLEELRQGGDGGCGRAGCGRRSRSRGRRASSRPTGWQPGKGVFVCRTQDELDAGIGAASALGGPLVIEELLEGDEVSLFALSDGRNAVPLAAARDYKRVGDGDTGPNTGGMGAFSPVPELGPAEVEELVDRVHRPVLAELARRGAPFAGLLYAGLMLTDDGPRVLEFNCRFGDPETQAVLPRLEGDLLEALAAAAAGDLARDELRNRLARGGHRRRRRRRLSRAAATPARRSGRRGRRGGGSARLPRRHRAARVAGS